MPVISFTSRTKFLCGATLSLGATLLLARLTSESWTLTVAGRFLAVALGLPVAIMTAGLATIFLQGILFSPECFLVVCFLVAIACGLPLSWVPALLISSALVYIVSLFVPSLKFFEKPIPLRLYEFGADRIVPYYAWLCSPRQAALSGILCGILIGIATIWGATLWHSVDSLSVRT